MNYEDERKKMCEIGKLMYSNKLAIANDGNISIRVAENEILVTPTRICKKDLRPDMIVRMDLDGNVLEGTHMPSSEVKMHLRVYVERPDLRVVIHTHSPFATAFATAGIALDRVTVPSAYCFLGKVPLTPYGTASTEEVPNNIARLIRDHEALLLQNHGVLVAGKALEETYFKAERVELYAQISLLAHLLGGARELSADELVRLEAKKERQKKMGLL